MADPDQIIVGTEQDDTLVGGSGNDPQPGRMHGNR